MSVPPVKRWIICVSGFLQNEGAHSGISIIQDKLFRQCSNDDTRVALKSWDDNPRHIADRIWMRRPNNEQPKVVLIGYSYGGRTVVQIAEQLKKRGIEVETMILCDAVYRPFNSFPSFTSMLPLWTLNIPNNVKKVYSFLQRTNKPQGHTVKIDDKRKTTHNTRLIEGVTHQYMDDLPEFRDLCLAHGCPKGDKE